MTDFVDSVGTAAGGEGSYDPSTFAQLTFHDSTQAFFDGSDSPRDYLERCIDTVERREPVVQGWESLRIDAARAEADASTERYRDGSPLSSVDGMPYGVKDLIWTRDLPTTLGIDGNTSESHQDSPSIQALRAAGAILFGKATTTELGGATPCKTTNPFHPGHTPGGSSSGSAAVVGARMVPMAIGSQVGGSLIRPAAYCANFALRPTLGGLNRGERLHASHGVIGIHAGSLTDMWHATIEIVKRAGGDPGYPGVFGADEPMPPRKPQRLIFVETGGWASVDEATRSALQLVVRQLERADVEIVRRADNMLVESFEQVLSEAQDIALEIIGWENRWSFENLADLYTLKPATLAMLEHGASVSLDRYRASLVRREEARQRLASIASVGDALLTLSIPGPAPAMTPPELPDSRVPYGTTGSPAFNIGTSILGVPSITLPLIGVGGLPVGVQVIGQPHQDNLITGIARWVIDNVDPVAVSAAEPGRRADVAQDGIDERFAFAPALRATTGHAAR